MKKARIIGLLVLAVTLVLTAFIGNASMNQFVGNGGFWESVDPNTTSVTRLEISFTPKFTVHAWGGKPEIDWGEVPGYAHGPNGNCNIDAQAQAVTAIFDRPGSIQTIMILTPSGNNLHAKLYNRITDNSGRPGFIVDLELKPAELVFSGLAPGAGKTIKGATTPLPAPTQSAPPPGISFSNYPRTTTLGWVAVQDANSYTVEIEVGEFLNSWKNWRQDPGQHSTSYTFDAPGPGVYRWRVWAVAANGVQGDKSPWWEFTYDK